jgi:hypothetical protein
MCIQRVRALFSVGLILWILISIQSRAAERLCGVESLQYNEKDETVANIKAARCTTTTRINVDVCNGNGGGSEPKSGARIWLGVNAGDLSQAIRVGYHRSYVPRVRVIIGSYYYHFGLPGACAKSDYVLGNPAAGAQDYSITRVRNIWRVNYAGTTEDSAADCATCDGVEVAYGAFVYQRETCCVGSATDTVAYTNCQRDVGAGMANPAGWVKHLTLPNYPVGGANPAAFVMRAEAANSFTIHDARNR